MEAINGIKIRWIYAACYEIELPNHVRILVDPFISPAYSPDVFSPDSIEKIDYILLTHVHIDHIADLKYFSEKYGARILCGSRSILTLAKALDLPLFDTVSVVPGSRMTFDDFEVYVSRAKHNVSTEVKYFPIGFDVMDKIRDGMPYSKVLGVLGSVECLDYLITTTNNMKILIAGGDERLKNSAHLAKETAPDIVIRQATTGMSPEDWAKVLSEYKAQLILPFHHEGVAFGKENGVEEYMEAAAKELEKLEPTSTLLNPVPLKWYRVGMTIRHSEN